VARYNLEIKRAASLEFEDLHTKKDRRIVKIGHRREVYRQQ
jgi:hypothetical protein